MGTKRARHKSADATLDRRLRTLANSPLVKKIVLGRTENARHQYPIGSVKFQFEVPNGIKAFGYSSRGITDLFIYCEAENRETIKELLDF